MHLTNLLYSVHIYPYCVPRCCMQPYSENKKLISYTMVVYTHNLLFVDYTSIYYYVSKMRIPIIYVMCIYCSYYPTTTVLINLQMNTDAASTQHIRLRGRIR